MDNRVQQINTDLIDDPAVAMRTTFDQEALADLAESIRTNGLIQPIILKEHNERYEVVAGHRRLQAHRLLGIKIIEAIVKDYTEAQAESAKVHENLFREDVNAVDQATFLARYLDRTKCDLNELARMLGRSTEWVSGRLEILKYPPYLIEQVYNTKISLGVAKWLNLIPNEIIRKEYTRFAGLQGINIKTAKRWSELAFVGELPLNPTELIPFTDPNGVTRYETKVRCFLCSALDDIGMLTTDFVHRECTLEYQNELQNAKYLQSKELTETEIKPEINTVVQ